MAFWHNKDWAAQVFVLIIGLIFGLPSLCKLIGYAEHRLHSQSAIAQVTKVGQGMYSRPYLQFVDHRGASHEFKSEIPFHFFFALERGDTRTVHYRQDRPERVLTSSPARYLLLPLVFVAIGFYLIGTILRAWFGRSVERRQTDE